MAIFRGICLFIFSLSMLQADVSVYKPNKYIKKEVWNEVAPHLLAPDHPMKVRLDELFGKGRVSLNIKTMKKGGFEVTEPREWTHLVLARHPKLSGYILKLYLDAQRCHKNLPDHTFWVARCVGVKKIEEMIATYGWQEKFKTPKKWIYPLPESPEAPKGFHRKQFILVEEDMGLLSNKLNHAQWKGAKIDEEFLDDLYCIIETLGLKDCAKPDNIPFTREGRIAFIDTQSHNEYPVNYEKLTPFLSPKMQRYWKALTKNSRNK